LTEKIDFRSHNLRRRKRGVTPKIDEFLKYGKGYKKIGCDENTTTDRELVDDASEYDNACTSRKKNKKRGRKQLLKNKKVNKYNLPFQKSQ